MRSSERRRREARRRERRRRAMVFAAVTTVVETATLWQRTGKPGGNIIVRCRDGHLYTTIWIPAVSLKAARLGFWRFQRCPVGNHWTFVTPVHEAQLTADERSAAQAQHDIRIP